MLAYKFLRPGAIGPFSGFRWPRPGEWVQAAEEGGACHAGVHACEGEHLQLWIWEELWEVELDGPIERRPHKLRAPRGRLVRQVQAWSAPTAKEFATACAGRAAAAVAPGLREAGHEDAAVVFENGTDLPAVRALTAELWDGLRDEVRLPVGMASDGAVRALTADASDDPYTAAHGAAVTGYIAAMTQLRVGGRDAYDAERAAQSDWLRERLQLAA